MPKIKVINMGFVNCYLVTTDNGFILIDTGFPSTRGALEKALKEEGCGSGNLKLIILTHGDIDHSGNAAYIKGRYGAKIAMHKGDSDMVENGNLIQPRKVKSALLKVMHLFMGRSKAFKKLIDNFERFKPDIYVDEGFSLKEYGFDAAILHIPGHTDGSVGVLSKAGDLFAGDTMVNRGRPGAADLIGNETKLAESIAKLKGLDIKTVYPGHGKPFPMEQLLKRRK